MSKCGSHIVTKKRDVLYPKRTRYRKYRKGRCSRGCKTGGTQLGFGRYGIRSCGAGRISYRAIGAARRAISGQFRRNGQIWVRVFADLPITGKPTEVRMGKGKGNPTGWIARVSTGQILFEMDGVSLSDARQAATLAAHKLCLSTKFVQWS
uniref:Large ribosomal subunit protein uL16m n=2 Tax=Spermatophyta TaxID=58024 RepID=D3TIC8_GINBI|nr:ribosomal protein L16 [Ginkgo biloba]